MGRQVQTQNPRPNHRPPRHRSKPEEAGDGAGLPAFALLWPTRFRQENPNHGPSSSDVWRHRREGQGREQDMESRCK